MSEPADEAAPQPQPPEDSDAVDLVRRRLLIQSGRYVAPAVIASVMLGEAYGQSSGPRPSCMPAVVPCAPFRTCMPG